MNYKSVYFIGIGGIGMSNLARYFLSKGKRVGGYDRTETPLTQALQQEGAFVHYEDEIEAIPAIFTKSIRSWYSPQPYRRRTVSCFFSGYRGSPS